MVGVRLFCFWFVREKILRLSFHLAGSGIGIVLGLFTFSDTNKHLAYVFFSWWDVCRRALVECCTCGKVSSTGTRIRSDMLLRGPQLRPTE